MWSGGRLRHLSVSLSHALTYPLTFVGCRLQGSRSFAVTRSTAGDKNDAKLATEKEEASSEVKGESGEPDGNIQELSSWLAYVCRRSCFDRELTQVEGISPL